MITREKFFASSLALLSLFYFSTEAMALPFSAIYVFGDSYSDAGNVAAANPGNERPVPYGPTDPPSYYAGGSFLNGPTWIERYAIQLGLRASPALEGGTNYAFGGARTGPLADPPGSAFPPSLLDQTSEFLSANGGTAPSEALYVIWGGFNDVFGDALPVAESGGDPTPILTAATGNIGSMIDDLETAGATNFLVLNLFDIGRTPQISLVQVPTDPTTARAVTEAFNINLASVLNGLEGNLAINLISFDLFALFDSIVADPAAFGFVDTSLPCAFVLVFGTLCNDPDEFLFWDGAHSTAAFHQILADATIKATVPEPTTFLLIGMGLAGIGLLQRRNRRYISQCKLNFTS